MPEIKHLTCPLCSNPNASHFHKDRLRDYYRCQNCGLTFVLPNQFLSAEAEHAEYDKHENSRDDPGYRNFLSRLFVPLNERLKPGSSGLDFGCGPGPTLSVMFEEAGHEVALYDPFYAPNENVFSEKYDFITATEVIEHLRQPAKDLERIWSLLKPGAWLGIMTKLALDETAFSCWHYKTDLTHVCFFSSETMNWLASQWQTKLLTFGKDAFLFQKNR